MDINLVRILIGLLHILFYGSFGLSMIMFILSNQSNLSMFYDWGFIVYLVSIGMFTILSFSGYELFPILVSRGYSEISWMVMAIPLAIAIFIRMIWKPKSD